MDSKNNCTDSGEDKLAEFEEQQKQQAAQVARNTITVQRLDPDSPESQIKEKRKVLKKQSSVNVISNMREKSMEAHASPSQRKNSNKIFQIAFMSGGQEHSAQPADEEDENEVGRKFHFPMKVGDLLEPNYFNKKN